MDDSGVPLFDDRGISVGHHSVIGAKSVLLKDCPDNMILYGIPAREIYLIPLKKSTCVNDLLIQG